MFQRYAASVWSDDERHEFIGWIAEHPEAGDVISEATPLRQVRWSRTGSGKRGGTRVIYYTCPAASIVYQLVGYPKSSTENLLPAFLAELRKVIKP
jgi:hypothetical protein